jgi:hypothetical protein
MCEQGIKTTGIWSIVIQIQQNKDASIEDRHDTCIRNTLSFHEILMYEVRSSVAMWLLKRMAVLHQPN